MKNLIMLILVIDKIIKLLISVEENNWSVSFMTFRERFNETDNQYLELLRSDILQIYGGMGSFSDLVLYSQGQPLIKENQKLEVLRKDLFRLLNDR